MRKIKFHSKGTTTSLFFLPPKHITDNTRSELRASVSSRAAFWEDAIKITCEYISVNLGFSQEYNESRANCLSFHPIILHSLEDASPKHRSTSKSLKGIQSQNPFHSLHLPYRGISFLSSHFHLPKSWSSFNILGKWLL